MKTVLFLALLITTNSFAWAQSLKAAKADSIYSKVDHPAEFKGGTQRLYSYLGDNLKMPPDENHVNGRVFVEFIVNKDGSIDDESVRALPFSILTKTRPKLEEPDVLKDQFCIQEALRLFKDSPNWIPAKQGDAVVRQRIVMPIKFDNVTKN
jgi:protein TonB